MRLAVRRFKGSVALRVVLVAGIHALVSSHVHAKPVLWKPYPSLRQILRHAADTQRDVVIAVAPLKCEQGPCLTIRQITSHRSFYTFADRAVFAWYTPSGEGADIVRRFRLWVTPSLLVLKGDGSEVGRAGGCHDISSLAQHVQDLIDRVNTVSALRHYIDAHPTDASLRLELAAQCMLRHEAATAREYLEPVENAVAIQRRRKPRQDRLRKEWKAIQGRVAASRRALMFLETRGSEGRRLADLGEIHRVFCATPAAHKKRDGS